MAAGLLKKVLVELNKRDEEEYRNGLLSIGMKKKQVEDMIAGFRDGRGALMRHLLAMEVVELVELEEKSG